MTRLIPTRSSLARTLSLWAAALALVCAQFLLVSHVHAEEHGHEGEEAGPTCSVCLFKAAGHELLGPLSGGTGLLPLPWPRTEAPAVQAGAAMVQGWWLHQPARGPPPRQPVI